MGASLKSKIRVDKRCSRLSFTEYMDETSHIGIHRTAHQMVITSILLSPLRRI